MVAEHGAKTPRRTVRERFDEKWIPEPNSGCWLWLRSLNSQGYGQLAREKRGKDERGRSVGPERAHRVAWELFRGPIPEGLSVLHRCDNPPCCNPDHLFLGTKKDNTSDMMRKNRHRGPRALTAQQVSEVQELLRDGRLSQTEIARRYGVSQMTISNVARGYQAYVREQCDKNDDGGK